MKTILYIFLAWILLVIIAIALYFTARVIMEICERIDSAIEWHKYSNEEKETEKWKKDNIF